MVSFASSIMTTIAARPLWLRFPVKLICCIAFGSASSACCLLKSIANHLIIIFEMDTLVNNQMRSHLLDQLQLFKCYRMLSLAE